jgi:hypothetical protein
LAAEFETVEAAVADGEPKLDFGVGHVAAQACGVGADLAADYGHAASLAMDLEK